MIGIVEVIESIGDSLMTLQGVSDQEIEQAEEKLETEFSDEYKDYLKTFGNNKRFF